MPISDGEPSQLETLSAVARRPTMREVAVVADVSLSTVSRVVNSDPSVRDDLARRVQEAVELLGYRRDLTATYLRRSDRQSSSIGFISEDVSNPFLAAVHRGIEVVARERGVLTLAGSSDQDPERERELAQAFCARRVDGLVIVPAADDHGYLLRERQAGVALVFVDRPPAVLDADCVMTDNEGGAATATEHLVAAGHRRIAFLGDSPRIHTVQERLRGYGRALDEHGISFGEGLVRTGLGDVATARAATLDLLRSVHAPTALFTAQNLITVGAVQALHELGLQHDVALVGFDDVLLADALEPGLTVVAQDAGALGRAAAEALFARLDGDTGPSRRVTLPTTLIRRGSGEIPVG